MPPNSAQYAPVVHDESFRSSQETLSLEEMEKQSLFDREPGSRLPPSLSAKIWSKMKLPWIISGILLLTNLALLIAYPHLSQKASSERQKSWLPPEISRTSLFEFQTMFGEALNNKSEEAWNHLMPIGRGFVIIKNDTALPDQPGLDQSIPEQKAMVAVFHQLHCIYMVREGYYSALEGNVDQVSKAHLTHCFDYLRQTVMCFGDTTLEWLPAPPNDTGSTGWGFEHQCRDFDAISHWAEKHRLKTTMGIH